MCYTCHIIIEEYKNWKINLKYFFQDFFFGRKKIIYRYIKPHWNNISIINHLYFFYITMNIIDVRRNSLICKKKSKLLAYKIRDDF